MRIFFSCNWHNRTFHNNNDNNDYKNNAAVGVDFWVPNCYGIQTNLQIEI